MTHGYEFFDYDYFDLDDYADDFFDWDEDILSDWGEIQGIYNEYEEFEDWEGYYEI